jgi:hypothetical protein
MDSSILPGRLEVSLPSNADRSWHRRGMLTRGMWLGAVIAAAACSSASGPAAPTTSQGAYLGTWSGTVTSSVIGAGAATLVFDAGFKSAPLIQVTGQWRFVFPDARFSGSGTITGDQIAGVPFFQLIFSSSTVPCPAEQSGVAEKGRSASVTVAGDRMYGNYMDNGCPGGTLELTRKQEPAGASGPFGPLTGRPNGSIWENSRLRPFRRRTNRTPWRAL